MGRCHPGQRDSAFDKGSLKPGDSLIEWLPLDRAEVHVEELLPHRRPPAGYRHLVRGRTRSLPRDWRQTFPKLIEGRTLGTTRASGTTLKPNRFCEFCVASSHSGTQSRCLYRPGRLSDSTSVIGELTSILPVAKESRTFVQRELSQSVTSLNDLSISWNNKPKDAIFTGDSLLLCTA